MIFYVYSPPPTNSHLSFELDQQVLSILQDE